MRVRYAGFAAGLMFLVGLGAVRSLAAQPAAAESVQTLQRHPVDLFRVAAAAVVPSGSTIVASDSRRLK